MTEYAFQTTPQDSGVRIDKYISDQLSAYTRSAVQALLEQEKVFVNGKIVKKTIKS